jgi:hypothetical protein
LKTQFSCLHGVESTKIRLDSSENGEWILQNDKVYTFFRIVENPIPTASKRMSFGFIRAFLQK